MCKVLKSNEVDVDVDVFSTQGKQGSHAHSTYIHNLYLNTIAIEFTN